MEKVASEPVLETWGLSFGTHKGKVMIKQKIGHGGSYIQTCLGDLWHVQGPGAHPQVRHSKR